MGVFRGLYYGPLLWAPLLLVSQGPILGDHRIRGSTLDVWNKGFWYFLGAELGRTSRVTGEYGIETLHIWVQNVVGLGLLQPLESLKCVFGEALSGIIAPQLLFKTLPI